MRLFLLIFRSRRQRITTNSDFLVDNPIYKTCNSTTSLVNSENGVISNRLELRAVGSSDSIIQDTAAASPSKFATAENPQYGSGSQLLPPPNHKPPRYIKVNTGLEPTYELIKNTKAETAFENGVSEQDNGNGTGDPIYSTPSPVLRSAGKGDVMAMPQYESTMDIPVIVGKDGEYAKLNHDSKT